MHVEAQHADAQHTGTGKKGDVDALKASIRNERELGDIEKAMIFYQKVLSINSNHTNANYNLGLIFYGLKEL